MKALRAAWAVAKNDLLLNRARPFATVVNISVPINFLILFVLFAIGGGLAPVGVYEADGGQYAAQMDKALHDARTYEVDRIGSEMQGEDLIANHRSVATIEIPPGFSEAVSSGKEALLPVSLNNLNEDFADDIRRGLPLAVLSFRRDALPASLPLRWDEADAYPSDVSFLGYLAVSIQTVALLIGGLLFGGRGVAGEWERNTIKELMLAPVPARSVVAGKLLAGLVSGVISAALILAVLLALGVHPAHVGELLGVVVLALIVFVSLGVAVGSLFRKQAAIAPFTFALGLPLFFISGAFGPISWSTAASAQIARLFPVAYANAAFQNAFHGYWPIDVGPLTLWGILAAWTVGALGAGALAYKRATALH